MEFRITIPDPIAPRVIDTICVRHGYQTVLEDGTPNPQTKTQFARQRIIQWIRDEVRDYEQNEAGTLARGQVTDIEI